MNARPEKCAGSMNSINPSRWELEWGIRKIRGGLKNQPHRFGGDFEKTPELYCKKGYQTNIFFSGQKKKKY